MAGGLKQQWGVDAPAQAGSDEQAQQFKAAFEGRMATVNPSLQFTAANAERALHDPLSARRDALLPAYQSANSRIDPANAASAQAAIDAVLADAGTLAGETSALKDAAEKALQAWQAHEASFDEAVRRIEELEAWEHPQAAALRTRADEIRQQTNERRYEAACTTLDALLPEIEPIYAEYLRQKEAKPEYEALLAEQSTRLAALKAAERPSRPMTAKAGDADTAIDQSKAKADARDYVAGLEQMQAVRSTVDELDKMTNDSERTAFLAEIGGVEQIAQAPAGKAFNCQIEAWTAITTLKDGIAPAGDDGDYAGANRLLAELKQKVGEFKARRDELEQQQAGYEAALAEVQPRLQAASALSEPHYASLQPMQQELAELQRQMDSSAQAEDFTQALAQAGELKGKLDTIEQARSAIDQQKQQYETALQTLQPVLTEVQAGSFKKLEAMQQEVATGRGEMESAAAAGDFDQALQRVQDLSTKCETIKTQAAELQKQKVAYDAALEPLQPRLAKAAESTDESLKPQQTAITTQQREMAGAGEAEDFDKAVALCADLAAKLDAFEQGAHGAKGVIPVEKTIKLASPVELKGAYCKVSAELQVKLKGSLELPSSKEKPADSTDITPLGYSDGLVMRVGETWYHGEGAQVCGVQTGIVESKLAGEAKVKDAIEFSFAGSVKFGNGEELKLKFVVAKVDGKGEVSGPGSELSYTFKSVSTKVKVDPAVFSGTIQLTLSGKLQPDYEAIGKLLADKLGSRAAQVLAGVAAADALIVAAAGGISVAIIYGGFVLLARSAEMRGLHALSAKIANQMVNAYVAGFQGGGSPGGPAAEGHRLGQAAFAKLKQSVTDKVPDATDEEIREHAKIESKRGFIVEQVVPRAKQAVWQAFAESNRGDRHMLYNGHVNLFGRAPSDSDPNYTRYLDEKAPAQ